MRIEKLQTTSHAAPPLRGTGQERGHFAAALSAAGQQGDHSAAPLFAGDQTAHSSLLPLSAPHRSTDCSALPLSSAHLSSTRPPVAISGRAQPADGTVRTDTATADDRLREVCRQFEAFFTAQLMQNMRESGSVEGFIKTSRAEKVFRAQHDAELARHLAQRGALGLGELLYRQLSAQIGTTALQSQTEGE